MQDEMPPHPSDTSVAHPTASDRRLPWGWITLAVLALAGFLAFNFIMSSRRAVHLVNGTPSSYTVEIDGQPQKLNANSVQKIRLAEGTHTVKLIPMPGNEAAFQVEPGVPNLPPVDGEQTFTLTGGMFSRGSGSVFVLNPDRTALIMNLGVGYGNATGGPDHLLEPQLLHAIPDIDHAFTEPPNSIEVSFGGGKTLRVLEVWETNDLEEQHAALAHEFNPDIADQMVERRFLLGPPTMYLVQTRDRLLDRESDMPSLIVDRPFKSSIPEAPKIDIPASPVAVAPAVETPAPDVAPATAWAPPETSPEQTAALAAHADGDDAPLRTLLEAQIDADGPDALAARLNLALLDGDRNAATQIEKAMQKNDGPAVDAALRAAFPLPAFMPALVGLANEPRNSWATGTLNYFYDRLSPGPDAGQLLRWVKGPIRPSPEDLAARELSPEVRYAYSAMLAHMVPRGKKDLIAAIVAQADGVADQLPTPPPLWQQAAAAALDHKRAVAE